MGCGSGFGGLLPCAWCALLFPLRERGGRTPLTLKQRGVRSGGKSQSADTASEPHPNGHYERVLPMLVEPVR